MQTSMDLQKQRTKPFLHPTGMASSKAVGMPSTGSFFSPGLLPDSSILIGAGDIRGFESIQWILFRYMRS